jgi:hypothetical protein
MTRRQARTLAIGILSSAIAAFVGAWVGIGVAAVILVLTSVTLDREARRKKRIERRSTNLARYLEDEIETLTRAVAKMRSIGEPPPRLLPLELHVPTATRAEHE